MHMVTEAMQTHVTGRFTTYCDKDGPDIKSIV